MNQDKEFPEMLLREEFEALELKLLAPYAVRSKDSKGRAYPEPPHEFRSIFQRDKERIIYTTAFRRLEYKTQVFVNHEGDHYRTRLTHSIEVSLVSRSIARALRLNEDLVEAIALAHDLGHSPFGHAGETVLNRLMKEEGGFEHNGQSLRILEELENCYADFKGLNLSFEVIEGIKKHSLARLNALEFQLVNLADDVAYNAHDLDDGLRSKYISYQDVEKLKVWERLKLDSKPILRSSPDYHSQTARAVRRLINYQIVDIIRQTMKNIQDIAPKNLEDLQGKGFHIVSFSPPVREEIKELRIFLKEKLYRHPKVMEMNGKAKDVISFLFEKYLQNPDLMPDYFVGLTSESGLKRVICDYIAGMTDRFAYREFDRLQKLQ